MLDRNVLLNDLMRIDAVEYIKKNYGTAVESLYDDIKRDFYTIIVLGEFKRGKSTFINALLNMDILPTNVLPETATINTVMYNETSCLTVIYKDGKVVQGEASLAYMERFSARAKDDFDEINYIAVGQPAEILANRIVVVDTPGVSDLNEHRNEITYDYIPKANAVIFMLDANSPLKKSEWDFIKQQLVPFGINNILFLLNKYDDIDEEEEDEDLVEVTRRKLQKLYEKENLKPSFDVLPLSAQMAYDGYTKNEQALYDASGIKEVKQAIIDEIHNGRIEWQKNRRYRARLLSLLHKISSDIDNELVLKDASIQELQDAKKKLDEIMSDYKEQSKDIDDYLAASESKIKAMVNKSLAKFHSDLTDDVHDQIDMYKGADFKFFIEKNLSKRITKTIENRIVLYAPHLNDLLFMVERELANGLSRRFNERVRLQASGKKELTHQKAQLIFYADDLTAVSHKADLIAAVGSVGLLVAFGGVLMPLVGFVARPALQKFFMEKGLSEAKQKILPLVDDEITKSISSMNDEISDYLKKRLSMIKKNSIYSYELLLQKTRRHILEEIENKNMQEEQDIQRIAYLKDVGNMVASMQNKYI